MLCWPSWADCSASGQSTPWGATSPFQWVYYKTTSARHTLCIYSQIGLEERIEVSSSTKLCSPSSELIKVIWRRLVQTGPYRYMRHPGYTGGLISGFGLWAFLGLRPLSPLWWVMYVAPWTPLVVSSHPKPL